MLNPKQPADRDPFLCLVRLQGDSKSLKPGPRQGHLVVYSAHVWTGAVSLACAVRAGTQHGDLLMPVLYS